MREAAPTYRFMLLVRISAPLSRETTIPVLNKRILRAKNFLPQKKLRTGCLTFFKSDRNRPYYWRSFTTGCGVPRAMFEPRNIIITIRGESVRKGVRKRCRRAWQQLRVKVYTYASETCGFETMPMGKRTKENERRERRGEDYAKFPISEYTHTHRDVGARGTSRMSIITVISALNYESYTRKRKHNTDKETLIRI